MKPKKNPVTKLVAAGVKGIITGKPKAIINGTSFTKGGKKVTTTPGGKVGRAIENKARAAINMPKGTTTGKAKAINKANYKIDGTPRTQGVAAVTVTKSGKLKEFMSNAPVKGATRRVRDTAQRAEREAKGYTKRQSVGKYPSNKLLKGFEKQANPKPKVPVKKKSK